MSEERKRDEEIERGEAERLMGDLNSQLWHMKGELCVLSSDWLE